MRENQTLAAKGLAVVPLICALVILVPGCATAAGDHGQPLQRDAAYGAFGAAWVQIYSAQRVSRTNPDQASSLWEQAATLLEEARANDPTAPDINNTLAACYVRLGKSDNAARVLIDTLVPGANEKIALDILRMVPDSKQVIAAFETALSSPDLQDEQRLHLLINAGRYAASNGHFANAVDYYSAAAAMDSSDMGLLLAAVSACAGANQHDRGIDLCLRFLEEPRDLTTLDAETFMGHLAVFYAAADRDAEALDFFLAAQERAPDSEIICRLCISFLQGLDRTDEAVAWGESFVEKHESAVEVRVALAEIYARIDSPKTEQALREILALRPRFRPARLALAEYLYDADEKSEAIALLRDGLDESTRGFASKLIRNHLAEYLDLSGAHEEAVAELNRILEDLPNDPQTCNHLGYLKAVHGVDLEEAERLVKVALSEDGENAAYLDSLAWIYYKMALRDDSMTRLRAADLLLRKAMADAPDPVITDHLGDVCFVQGLLAEAADNWGRVIEAVENGAREDHLDVESVRRKLEYVQKLIEQVQADTSPPSRPFKPPSWDE